MQISIKREDLLKPLGFVAGVVERRQTLPILSNALLRLVGNELTLCGTDMEVEIIESLQGVSGEAGEITIPARKLYDICRALPEGATIKIDIDKQKAIVKSGRSRFSLLTLPASEFPIIETKEWERSLRIPQASFKRVLEKTQFCMAQQDVRYYLNGLMLEVEGKQLRGVATDGHRMAISEHTLAESIKEGRQVIVPRKGVHELLRLLDSTDEELEIKISPNHLRASRTGMLLTTKLIDGRFPEYRKVIPENQSVKLNLDKDALRETLARAAILSNEKYRGVRLKIENNTMRISAHNPEQEEAQEEIPISYAGPELEIGFNVNYMTDAISAVDGAQVEVGLTDANSSCTIRNPDDGDSQYVIMPMRL